MTRIASMATNTTIVNIIQRTQQRLFATEIQVASEQISQTYQGISADSQRLIDIENLNNLLGRYQTNNNTMETRLSVAAIAMESAEETIRQFNTILTEFGREGTTDRDAIASMQDWAFRSLLNMESFLNTVVDGRFLFSGSRTDVEPVDFNLSTLAAFQAIFDGARTTYATTREAHLSDFSFSEDTLNLNGPFVTAGNFLTFRQDDDGDIRTGGTSSIEATSALFANVKVGSTITISGTASNNGTYTVESVSNGNTRIQIVTEMLTDEAITQTLANEAGAGAVVITRPDATTLNNGDTGNITFDATAGTIVAANGGSLTSINTGDLITISGSASNNGSYTVLSNDATTITVKINTTATFTLADGKTVLGSANTGDVLFDRSTDTFTAAVTGAFSAVTAGEIITVAGTPQNDGTYTVKSVSGDGKTVTVESNKLTDEGLSSGNKFFDYKVGTKTVFNQSARTIQAQDNGGTALTGAYSYLKVGDSITVSGSSITPPLFTKVIFANNGTPNVDTIQVVADDGTTPIKGVFADVKVGDTITLLGATVGANDAVYTVNTVSADGSTITVNGDINTAATDSASIAFTGASITNFTTRAHFDFSAVGGNTERITLKDASNAAIGAGFDALQVGMQITIANATTGGNDGTYRITAVNSVGGYIDVTNLDNTDPSFNAESSVAATTLVSAANDGTYTIDTISSDGSTITVAVGTPLIADQTDTDGTTVTGAGSSFTSGTKLFFDAATEKISAVKKSTGEVVTNAFANLLAGQLLTIAGAVTNNGVFTINTVGAGVLTVAENITSSESVPGAATLSVFGAAGTVAATSYYNGDEIKLTHRVSGSREFEYDFSAISPAFEKAIRAMFLIAQGKYGTEGGLDHNTKRLRDAKYLLESATVPNVAGTPPFGAELSGDTAELQTQVAFDRVLLTDINIRHQTLSTFLEGQIAGLENIDMTEAITRLLDDSRALEASFQSLARIRNLSLSNFLR